MGELRRRLLLPLIIALAVSATACGARVQPAAPERVDAAGVDAAGVETPTATTQVGLAANELTAAGRALQDPLVHADAESELIRLAAEPERHRVPQLAEPAWTPFATVGGVTLHHPAASIARIGFHESNHDGARQLDVAATAANHLTLPTRDRGTGSRTAADVVVDPAGEIRSPVTGTVLRAGTYVLYCEHADDYAVIEPDGHPGWEVKVLHITGVQVSAGDRVEAGRTVIAPRPTPLPFRSQVDDFTPEPSWPHVHIEVVDPTIPDRPSPGGSC